MRIDTHVHVYDCYDLAELLRNLRSRCDGMVLVEREGQDVFGAWRKGEGLPGGCAVREIDGYSLRLSLPESLSGQSLLVVAGRQIACAERLEILAVGSRAPIRDGVTCAEAVDAILADGGRPVLAWGVGKWLGSRAKVVEALVKKYGDSLALGDTALRPVGWPAPAAMRAEGRLVLAGSDPLPKRGEERVAGTYGIEVSGTPEEAGTRAWTASWTPDTVRAYGHRASPADFVRRRFF